MELQCFVSSNVDMKHSPILLAEDNDDDVFFVQRAFSTVHLSSPLQVVRDGEQVLAYLKGHGEYADRQRYPFPTLLLLDIKMPRMNGFETLSAIRQDPELKRLVVVFLTSSRLQCDVNNAFDLRANSYIVKPSTGDQMAEACERFKNLWLRLNQFPQVSQSVAGAN